MKFNVRWKSQSPDEGMVVDCGDKEQAKELFFAEHGEKDDTLVIESGGEVSFHDPTPAPIVNEQDRTPNPNESVSWQEELIERLPNIDSNLKNIEDTVDDIDDTIDEKLDGIHDTLKAIRWTLLGIGVLIALPMFLPLIGK